MTKKYVYMGVLLAGIAIAATRPFAGNPYGLTKGSPEIKSITALSFGKDGILFVGDSKSASIFAVETKDAKADKAAEISVAGIDQKIAL